MTEFKNDMENLLKKKIGEIKEMEEFRGLANSLREKAQESCTGNYTETGENFKEIFDPLFNHKLFVRKDQFLKAFDDDGLKHDGPSKFTPDDSILKRGKEPIDEKIKESYKKEIKESYKKEIKESYKEKIKKSYKKVSEKGIVCIDDREESKLILARAFGNKGTEEKFHFLAFPMDESITSIRKLNKSHIKLLEAMCDIREEIAETFGVPKSEIYAYFNYTPGTYWLHCHYVRFNSNPMQSNVHACWTLELILEWIKQMPDETCQSDRSIESYSCSNLGNTLTGSTTKEFSAKKGTIEGWDLTMGPLKLGPLGLAIYYFVDHKHASIRKDMEKELKNLLKLCSLLDPIVVDFGKKIEEKIKEATEKQQKKSLEKKIKEATRKLKEEGKTETIDSNKEIFKATEKLLKIILTYCLVKGGWPIEKPSKEVKDPSNGLNGYLELHNDCLFEFKDFSSSTSGSTLSIGSSSENQTDI